jgi:hypothetical protein
MKLRHHPKSQWQELLQRRIAPAEFEGTASEAGAMPSEDKSEPSVPVLGECTLRAAMVTPQDPLLHHPPQLHLVVGHQGRALRLAHVVEDERFATRLCQLLNAQGQGKTLHDIGELDIV